MFDDSLLDDPVTLERRGYFLRDLALRGARLRCEPDEDLNAVVEALSGVRPRSIVVIGNEARLIRALLEPTCPVPCVAWPMLTLPPWAGPLDLVVILAGADPALVPACLEAVKRGSMLCTVATSGSPLLDQPVSSGLMVTRDDDAFVNSLLACAVLDRLGLAPAVDLGEVADVLDAVAERCGPRYTLETNPAKNLACALADATPLLWGGSVLAARAARRVAVALRQATGLPALAADDQGLIPLLEHSRPRDLFADPFEDIPLAPGYCVLLLDDGESVLDEDDLAEIALSRNSRVETIRADHPSPVVRYASLLHQGMFAAAYLGLATVPE